MKEINYRRNRVDTTGFEITLSFIAGLVMGIVMGIMISVYFDLKETKSNSQPNSVVKLNLPETKSNSQPNSVVKLNLPETKSNSAHDEFIPEEILNNESVDANTYIEKLEVEKSIVLNPIQIETLMDQECIVEDITEYYAEEQQKLNDPE